MGAKILIVDDEPSLLRLTQFGLEFAGYQVITAETGQDALNKIVSEQPDLIVLEVALDLSGRDQKIIAAELTSAFGTFAQQLSLEPAWTLADLLELEPARIDEAMLNQRLVEHPSGLRVLFAAQEASHCKAMQTE